ncbi:MAG: AI-2E family transporter [Candidatus Cloacimonetes bacterium]|nr:AI-2E family transporter [Candidatus Cloacimonadota bacterium]
MKQNNKVLKFSYYILLFAAIGFGTFFYKNVMVHFILSLLFVFLVNPLVNSIEQLGVPRTLAVLIFYLIFFFSLFMLGTVLMPVLVRQIKSFAQIYINFINQENPDVATLPYLANLQTIINNIQNLFPFIDFESIRDGFFEKSNDLLSRIPDMLLAYSGNVFRIFGYLFAVPILGFFILKDKVFLKKKIYSFIPNKYFEISVIIIDKIKGTIGIYLRALFIECSIVGIMAMIVLTALGVPFGIFIGFFAGVTNVIPYLGPLMGILLGGLTVILTGGSTTLLLWTILGMWGVQLIDNAFVYPLVMGKNTNIHPVLVILSIVAGGISFGLIGMLLAVPTVFLVTVILTLLYKSLKQFEFI